MNERNEKTVDDQHLGRLESKPASAGSFERPGMNLSSNTPEGKPGVLSRLLAWHISHGPETISLNQAELQQQLQAIGRERMPFGQRLRDVRRALGWTQRMAAVELGINARTVIRHEKGHHRRPWVRTPLLLKLRDLEAAYAGEIVAYLTRVGREHA